MRSDEGEQNSLTKIFYDYRTKSESAGSSLSPKKTFAILVGISYSTDRNTGEQNAMRSPTRNHCEQGSQTADSAPGVAT